MAGALLAAAVEHAVAHSAAVVEGYPVHPAQRPKAGPADLYHGTLGLFLAAGFTVVTGGVVSGAAVSDGALTGGVVSGAAVSDGALTGGVVSGAAVSDGALTGGVVSGAAVSDGALTGGVVSGAVPGRAVVRLTVPPAGVQHGP
ncbi:hypothetical protein SAMN05660473_03230 [Arthrobacter sp. 49Tsu3.1M3]|uniref:hypothetical protein n=1 Tax=Arthrobacter sp. 49Tsu3.1M3 TaxID=1279029 RepID=UPI0009CC5BF6|nr:hypothetical protein [Arthrobacter sp. 49Tsu3.1M3]SKB95287.1 hypothetical protein SAMN05660473_03230 [Arthrobacter sp. 49Tsu3.1M3]